MSVFEKSGFRSRSAVGVATFAVLLGVGGCSGEPQTTSTEASAPPAAPAGEAGSGDASSSAESSRQKDPQVTPEAMGEAALNGEIAVVVKAVEQGADVNAVDQFGLTPLMKAAYNGHTAILTFLLDHDADVSLRDQQGNTALFHAASGETPSSVKVLLEAGAEVDSRDDGEGFTPLMVAAAEGQLENVQLLLDHGADPKLVDIDNDSALSFARQSGHAEIVKLLQATE